MREFFKPSLSKLIITFLLFLGFIVTSYIKPDSDWPLFVLIFVQILSILLTIIVSFNFGLGILFHSLGLPGEGMILTVSSVIEFYIFTCILIYLIKKLKGSFPKSTI